MTDNDDDDDGDNNGYDDDDEDDHDLNDIVNDVEYDATTKTKKCITYILMMMMIEIIM